MSPSQVLDALEEARRCLASGNDKRACETLSAVIAADASPIEIEQVRAFAAKQRAEAGFLGKRRWEDLLRRCDEAALRSGGLASSDR